MRLFIPASLITVTTLALGLVSCGGPQGPVKPQPGTPGFVWANAEESLKKGNFIDFPSIMGIMFGSTLMLKYFLT